MKQEDGRVYTKDVHALLETVSCDHNLLMYQLEIYTLQNL